MAPVVTVAAGTRWVGPPLGVRPTLPAARGSSQLATIAESLTGTKIKNFFIVVLIPKPFLKFPDKLIGKGCPTTGVLSMWNEKQRIASLHLAETVRLEADSAAP